MLSHKVAPEKMPSCKFFLEGLCSRGEDCPYRHVKVSANADICPEYLKGYCSAGQECKLRHVSRCPQFEKTGVCARGQRCPYPHTKADANAAKKAAARKRAPPKPKRKSAGGQVAVSAAATGENKKAKMRYFEEDAKALAEEEEAASEPLSEAMEAKRKRLLRKVELAKQGWVEGKDGGADKAEPDLDDSGPYEEIEERAPLGDLPAYIPLEGGGGVDDEDEEEEEFEERLI